MPTRLRPSVLVVMSSLCMLGATGCTSWKTQSGDVATIVAPVPSASSSSTPVGIPGSESASAPADAVRRIRVTALVRGEFELWNPRVVNDSLFGQLKPNGPELGIPVTDVATIQTRETSGVKTGFLVGGVAVVMGGFVAGAIAGADGAVVEW